MARETLAAAEICSRLTSGMLEKCVGSMNQTPPMMKIASGRSLPIVSALTNHEDCLMPRTLIQVRNAVRAVIVAARGAPIASAGQ